MKQGVKIDCAGGNQLSKNTYIFIGSLLNEERLSYNTVTINISICVEKISLCSME